MMLFFKSNVSRFSYIVFISLCNSSDMVVKAFGLRSVNVEGWVQSLSLEQTTTLLNRIKEQTKTGMHKSAVSRGKLLGVHRRV